MRTPHSKPPSPPRPTARSPTRFSHSPNAHSVPLPMEHPSSSRDRPPPGQLPVLRWLAGTHSRSLSHSIPTPPSPSCSAGPSTPSSAASALADALHDDPVLLTAHRDHHRDHPASSELVTMPSVPEAARLPSSLRFARPPRYLSNLTRSTMPTAGLSPPPTADFFRSSYTYTDPFVDPFPAEPDHNPALDIFYSPTPDPVAIPHTPAPAHLNSSPPSSRSPSLDSLRSLQARGRGLHTTPPQQAIKLPSLPDSIWNWFGSDDSKENLNPLLGEEDRASTVQAQRAHIRKKYYAPHNPVVFCHGLLGFDTVTLGPSIAPLQVTHWRGIKDALEANGAEVLVTRVPATSSPIDRAKVLCEKISEAYPGRSVHLIGHSMGGVDCRYLTTHLTQRPFKVLSVTTISAPHRGSSFADHFLSTIGPSRMPSVLSLLDLLPNGGGDGKAFEFLTVENMRRFNEDTPDVPGVKYFSWGAMYEPGLIDTWKWPHSVVMEKEGPNDGLVSLKSARWGTYLGTLEGVNHLDLIGWVNTARYKWAEIMGRELKFKPATFYLGIADHLARVVEGQGQGGDALALLQAEESGSSREGSAERALREERNEIRREGERAAMADSLDKGGSRDGDA